MKDRVLIDSLIDATLPRIRELTAAMYAQARVEATTADEIVATLHGNRARLKRPSPLDEATQVAIDDIWRAPLSSACVSLLRAVAAKATGGVFRVSPRSIREVLDALDLQDLRRKMGLHEADIRLVLPALGDGLSEVVRSERGKLTVAINRQEISLVADERPAKTPDPR